AFEAIVNTCFIMAEGKAAADRARRHAHQKSYRDLDREICGTGLRLVSTAKDEQASNPGLQADLALFTHRNGRENIQWTDENIPERIATIERKYGRASATGLRFALFAIYRHSSEIAHGSLFGALFSLGLTLPGTPQSGV